MNGADRLAALAELLSAARGAGRRGPGTHPDEDDVAAPYRGDDALYALSASQLVPATHA